MRKQKLYILHFFFFLKIAIFLKKGICIYQIKKKKGELKTIKLTSLIHENKFSFSKCVMCAGVRNILRIVRKLVL